MIPERLLAHTRNPRKLVNAVRASSRDNGDKIRTQFEYFSWKLYFNERVVARDYACVQANRFLRELN